MGSAAAVWATCVLGLAAPTASGQTRGVPAVEAPAHGGRGAAPDEPAEDTAEPGLPPGHPQVKDSSPPEGHAQAAAAIPGVFHAPEDVEHVDPSLPPGTIAVELRDADDRPLAGEAVTLGILINSIAKGDSRKHLQQATDARGATVFSGLDTASNIAYRVSSGYEGGSFAASPFQLGEGKAMRVVLHVYPVTHDLQETLVLCEAAVAAELRDDRIQIEEMFTLYNLGRAAWQPEGVTLSLPSGFTALTAQPSMSDQGVDAVEGGARLRGTFPPGQHSVEFRWQLPWSDEKDVDFEVGLPPHVAIARVIMPASATVKLSAEGFPPADLRRDAQGQSFLVTEKRLRPEDPKLRTLAIGIHDLPVPGPGRQVATVLAAFGVVVGLVLAGRRGRRGSGMNGEGAVDARRTLLEDLAALEDARAAGDVGPRTYETARRELIDALAMTLAKS